MSADSADRGSGLASPEAAAHEPDHLVLGQAEGVRLGHERTHLLQEACAGLGAGEHHRPAPASQLDQPFVAQPLLTAEHGVEVDPE